MIQRSSNSNIINSIFNNVTKVSGEKQVPEMKKDNIKKDRSWEKLSSSNDVKNISDKNVCPAYYGNIKNEGGPSRQLKVDSSNTIFDSNKIESLKSVISSKERTIAEKNQIKKDRMAKQSEYIKSQMPSNIEESSIKTDRKVGVENGFSGRSPVNNISIFDSHDYDYERIKQSSGESIEPRKKIEDSSWKKISKQKTVQDVFTNMFDNISDKLEKK